jgi:hypothetical protein
MASFLFSERVADAGILFVLPARMRFLSAVSERLSLKLRQLKDLRTLKFVLCVFFLVYLCGRRQSGERVCDITQTQPVIFTTTDVLVETPTTALEPTVFTELQPTVAPPTTQQTTAPALTTASATSESSGMRMGFEAFGRHT